MQFFCLNMEFNREQEKPKLLFTGRESHHLMNAGGHLEPALQLTVINLWTCANLLFSVQHIGMVEGESSHLVRRQSLLQHE